MKTFWTIVTILPIIWLIRFLIGIGELIHIRLLLPQLRGVYVVEWMQVSNWRKMEV